MIESGGKLLGELAGTCSAGERMCRGQSGRKMRDDGEVQGGAGERDIDSDGVIKSTSLVII